MRTLHLKINATFSLSLTQVHHHYLKLMAAHNNVNVRTWVFTLSPIAHYSNGQTDDLDGAELT